MWIARAGWGIWVLGAALLCLFTEIKGAPLLLAAFVGVPLLLILVAALSHRFLTVSLSASQSTPKGKGATCLIHAENRGLLPFLRLEAVLDVTNGLTGEKVLFHRRFAVPSKGEAQFPVLLSSLFCGKFNLRIKEIWAYDWCCLSRFRCGGIAKEAFCLFLPATFAPDVEVGAGGSLDMESNEYSMLKPGFDPSETFAIREYLPGDKLNKIHWKLSTKLGDLVIREPSLPICNLVLILWETAAETHGKPISPEKMDAMAETIISISQSLLERHTRHRICWIEPEGSLFHREDIGEDDDLTGALGNLLSVGGGGPREDVAARFLSEEQPGEYAHIVLVTDRLPDELPRLADEGSRVTVLLCGEGVRPENEEISVIPYLPENMERDLAYVEI